MKWRSISKFSNKNINASLDSKLKISIISQILNYVKTISLHNIESNIYKYSFKHHLLRYPRKKYEIRNVRIIETRKGIYYLCTDSVKMGERRFKNPLASMKRELKAILMQYFTKRNVCFPM